MYRISDKQIDYILSDIRARGVEMESLQQNLLDHICCIIERNLGDKGDFESFYQSAIKTFYKDALWEIEEETITLLTFKNYYTMKKIMIVSGAFAAVAMTFGILFKFMHWPGAGVLLVLGITSASFVFLPLLFTLKAREKQKTKDKLILAIGAIPAILISLSILFKVMFWPYANLMGAVSLIMMAAVFLPVYFFTGIRNPETRVNTITSSVLIILGCGLFLTLMRTPQSSYALKVKNTRDFVRSQVILENEQLQVSAMHRHDSAHNLRSELGAKINRTCQELKEFILVIETGYGKIGGDFEEKNQLLDEHSFRDNPFLETSQTEAKMNELERYIREYNQVSVNKPGVKPIPTKGLFTEQPEAGPSFMTVFGTLNQLTQIQMFVLQYEKELLAVK